MKERIFEILNPIIDTYYLEAPEDSEETPVCIYYFLGEEPIETLDDQDYGRETELAMDIYSKEDTDDMAVMVEETLKMEFDFCYLRAKRETKEDGFFRLLLEFTIQTV